MLWFVAFAFALALSPMALPDATVDAALLGVGAASFSALTSELKEPPSEVTIAVTLEACRLTYRYSSPERFEVTRGSAREPGEPRGQALVAEAREPVLVPSGRTVKILVSAIDSIQPLVVPALGIRVQAVPGAIRETWFRVERPGDYIGQATRGCTDPRGGVVPALRAVEPAEFATWAVEQAARSSQRSR